MFEEKWQLKLSFPIDNLCLNRQNENEMIKRIYLKLADIWLGESLVIIRFLLPHILDRYME